MQISVVMPVYNMQKYLAQSIESILQQTHKNIEFILVNDGSVDQSKEMIEQAASRDKRIKVIHFEENRGVATALNAAIEQASGTWIAVQDADDISLPHRLQAQAGYINSHPDLLAVGSFIKCFADTNLVPAKKLRSIEKFHNSLVTREQIEEKRFFGCPLSHGSVTFNKQAFLRAGGYDPRYKIAADYDLWMKLLQMGPIENIPEVLYQYRFNPRSLSHLNWNLTANEIQIISSKYIRNMLYELLGKEPKFIVMGPNKSCKQFQEIICCETFQVHNFISNKFDETLASAYEFIGSGEADGIIVLKSTKSKKIMRKLESMGMRINNNLFHLYNALT